jgi:hypothetical protein
VTNFQSGSKDGGWSVNRILEDPKARDFISQMGAYMCIKLIDRQLDSFDSRRGRKKWQKVPSEYLQ